MNMILNSAPQEPQETVTSCMAPKSLWTSVIYQGFAIIADIHNDMKESF